MGELALKALVSPFRSS